MRPSLRIQRIGCLSSVGLASAAAQSRVHAGSQSGVHREPLQHAGQDGDLGVVQGFGHGRLDGSGRELDAAQPSAAALGELHGVGPTIHRVARAPHQLNPAALAAVRLPDAPVVFDIAARNVRRFGELGSDGTAAYLFNHFTAPDPDAAVAGWELVSGWYAASMDVDNSLLLQPAGESPSAVVNHVRLPVGPVRFLLGQLLRPSFHRFVRPVLRRSGMVALPLIVRPVRPGRPC